MANGMGSFWVGVSGLQSSQNALNTTANNMANVDTKGYVRQQVLQEDKSYITFNTTAAISRQQSGLGVNIGDVVHTRDIFLDLQYRVESSRHAFYENRLETINSIEDMFQELEGTTYQQALEDFWVSFQELSKQPDEGVVQNLVVQKGTLFLERSQNLYDTTIKYQKNLNVQIHDTVERINDLGKRIHELNEQIRKIESANIETAMTLRDERDYALDELSKLIKTSYEESVDGSVKVKLEDVIFIDGENFFEMGMVQDPETEFLTPYWPYLSDEEKGEYHYTFDFSHGVKSSNNTDLGKLKSMILSRGDDIANYTDIQGLTKEEYNTGLGQSIIMDAQAQLDQMIHLVATTVNDILSPLATTSFVGRDGTVYNNVRVWDAQKGCVGKDGKGPGEELFVRNGCSRYREVEADDGTIYYVYNEEDPEDTDTQYTTRGMKMNEILLKEEGKLPHIAPNGEVDYDMAHRLAEAWSLDAIHLNPNDEDPCNIKDYYQRMIDGFATEGGVYQSLTTTLEASSTSIENQRQQVIGVSSDEELTNMIKFQNAYNASSRYINVISEMLEHLIMQLGA